MSKFNVRPEVKAQYLAQRLDQLNSEGWAHELNLATAEALPEGAERDNAIAQAESSINIIADAITVIEAQISVVETQIVEQEPAAEEI
jgi:hypothetical protein